MGNIEEIAKAFYEAVDLGKWEDVENPVVREWYLRGAKAVWELWDLELERQHADRTF